MCMAVTRRPKMLPHRFGGVDLTGLGHTTKVFPKPMTEAEEQVMDEGN